MSSNSRNRDVLLRWSGRVRRTVAADAVRAGQAVIAEGLRRRCPRGVTHELVNSIEETRPEVGARGATGRVIVASDHALAVEYGTTRQAAEPFVRPTVDVDGPRAEAAMADVLRRGVQ